MNRFWVVMTAFFAAGPALAAPAPDLDRFLSYSFVSAIAVPDSGDRVAWIEYHQGKRNVWLADGPGLAARPLTAGTRDDGQDLTALAWTPDGTMLAWERGEVEHNGWASGAPANPDSMPTEPAQEIWVSIRGAAPVKVAEGEAPALSAKGQLVFVKDGQVWTADPSGQGKPARLFYDRGKDDSLVWSPDGSRLAFVSRRGDHSFIGIYSGADRPIVWLSPATAYDGEPVWSPDGRRVAFVRQDGIADLLASPLVETPSPFSIWVADAADGSAAPAWRSPNTLNGSYPEISGGLFLMWGAGDRLTFRAELDGWAHLYSLPAAGGQPQLLTPGNFIVEHVTLSPDRKTLYYSANAGADAGDIDRRHLFKVPVDRAAPVALTSGTGVEWSPVPLRDGRIAFIGGTPIRPPHAMMLGASGQPATALDDTANDYPSDLLAPPRQVMFKAADGLEIHGQLFLPRGGAGKRPALIFVHGGPPRQMLLGWSYMDYYTHAYAMNQYLAAHGYVVLSVNYRLGIGYGRAFQHPAKAGAVGNSEYQDVLAGAHFLQALPEVDPARIGIWGGSYGGLLTAHALAHDSAIFKVGVDFHGVHDWSLYPDGGAPKRYEQGDYAARQKLAFESSPEAALGGWRSPVLLIHGDDDRNVRFDQTVDLARRLSAQGAPFEELILPNEIHGFLRYDSWRRADAASIRFLDQHLKR